MPDKRDTYFLNRDVALTTALQRNTVILPDDGKGLQICYYNGEPIADAPDNLICVPFDNLFNYFLETVYRPPTYLNFEGIDISIEKRTEMDKQINNIFEKVTKARDKREEKYIALIRHQVPDFRDKTKRVFLMTSRHTSVIQYSSRGIANALSKLGYDIKFMMEEDNMQLLYKDWRMKELYQFNPHITFNINHMFNDFINEKTWNIVWWQDPIEELVSGEPVNVRERDIVFSFDKAFDDFWIKKQVTPILRQDFCIDSDIFFPDTTIVRENKVVFIGGSYFGWFKSQNADNGFQRELISWLEDGIRFTENDVLQLGYKYSLSFENYPVPSMLQGVVRDTTVKWLCEESHMKVEIYGRNWEGYEFAKPFFKGELPHGKAVADVYCSAKYALVCSGANIQNQRLFETAACGTIPIVFDSRPFSSDPLWEDQYLFFRTRNELKNSLWKEPKMVEGTVERINSKFSYDCFAKKIDRMTSKCF